MDHDRDSAPDEPGGIGNDSPASAVACSPGGGCLATGAFVDTNQVVQALLIEGSGTTWTASEAPLPSGANPGPFLFEGFGLTTACPPTGGCAVAGFYNGPNGLQSPFADTPSFG